MKDVLWNQLARTAQSSDAGHAVYGIQKLDQMSGGSSYPDRFNNIHDFDHAKVLEVLRKLLTSADAKIAQAAIGAVAGLAAQSLHGR